MQRLRPIIMVFLVLSSCVSAQIFRTTTPLPVPRQMYGAAVAGEYLYIIGGNYEPDTYTRSVEMALINLDGTLGPWVATTELPQSRSYINNTTLVLNDVIYVAQGLEGVSNEKLRTILWTRSRSDGHLEPWQESPPCPGEGVSCSVAVATPGYIHIIGGSIGDSIPYEMVWSAKLATDGGVVSWEKGPPLPVPLWFLNAGVVGNKVYAWGGLTESLPSSVSQDIYIAPVLPSGQLGTWSLSDSKLEVAFYSASCTVVGNFLFSFCPRYKNGDVSGDVWFTTVENDTLAPWSKLSAEIPARLFNSVATSTRHDIVYLPGGRLGRESRDYDKNVYYFPLTVKEHSNAPHPAPPPPVFTPLPTPTLLPVVQSTPTQNPVQPLQVAPTMVSQGPQSVVQLSGFLPYTTARAMLKNDPKPLVLYFHAAANEQCIRQLQILQDFQTGFYGDSVLFAELNTETQNDLAQQFAVTAVPYWILFDAEGKLASQYDRVLQKAEITLAVGKLLP